MKTGFHIVAVVVKRIEVSVRIARMQCCIKTVYTAIHSKAMFYVNSNAPKQVGCGSIWPDTGAQIVLTLRKDGGKWVAYMCSLHWDSSTVLASWGLHQVLIEVQGKVPPKVRRFGSRRSSPLPKAANRLEPSPLGTEVNLALPWLPLNLPGPSLTGA